MLLAFACMSQCDGSDRNIGTYVADTGSNPRHAAVLYGVVGLCLGHGREAGGSAGIK